MLITGRVDETKDPPDVVEDLLALSNLGTESRKLGIVRDVRCELLKGFELLGNGLISSQVDGGPKLVVKGDQPVELL